MKVLKDGPVKEMIFQLDLEGHAQCGRMLMCMYANTSNVKLPVPVPFLPRIYVRSQGLCPHPRSIPGPSESSAPQVFLILTQTWYQPLVPDFLKSHQHETYVCRE